MTRILTSTLAAALIVAGANGAFGQDGQTQPKNPATSPGSAQEDTMQRPQQGMGGGMGMGHGMRMRMGRGMGMESGVGMRMGGMGGCLRGDGKLGDLKKELAITETGEAAWTEYADALKAQAETMKSNRAAMMKAMSGDTGLIQRLDARINAMQAMLNSLTAVKSAAEKLYGTLDPDQKKKADSLLGMGCMMSPQAAEAPPQ